MRRHVPPTTPATLRTESAIYVHTLKCVYMYVCRACVLIYMGVERMLRVDATMCRIGKLCIVYMYRFFVTVWSSFKTTYYCFRFYHPLCSGVCHTPIISDNARRGCVSSGFYALYIIQGNGIPRAHDTRGDQYWFFVVDIICWCSSMNGFVDSCRKMLTLWSGESILFGGSVKRICYARKNNILEIYAHQTLFAHTALFAFCVRIISNVTLLARPPSTRICVRTGRELLKDSSCGNLYSQIFCA